MLVDNVTITIKAGDGGNGVVHFIRNSRTPRGGPDGGNGGNGGNLYVQGVDDISALQQFRFKKRIEAENGVNGGRQNMFGRNGEDMVMKVPVGTKITETQTGRQVEVSDKENRILLAKGGIGGRGNNEFKSATNQAPKYAERGTPGEEKEILLELRLIADVGLIGLPNAGKSSLLAALTNARPKIGDYQFTTLEPNLGVLSAGSTKRFEAGCKPAPAIIIADIPGLIEGASEGRGLGIKFLQHIEKTKLLAHCIASDNENVLETYNVVRKELGEYNPELLNKQEIILLTKIDLVDEKSLKEKMKQLKRKNKHVIPVSIYDEKRLEELQEKLLAFINQ